MKQRMKALRLLLVVVATCASALIAMTPVPARAASRVDGVVADLTWYISRADMDRSIGLLQAAGLKTVRANINWSSIEPNAKGSLDSWWLSEIDYAVSTAQTAGIEILMPIADGVPYWASADPNRYSDGSGNHWDKNWKPRLMQDYADFASAIVKRYAPKGVHAYEVWNEPNYSRFWPSGPNAADYVSMLKAAYPAIKAADPSATVVSGGLSRNDVPFIKAMYAAGAQPYFDALAVHPYTHKTDPTVCTNTSNIDQFCSLEFVRSTMVSYGDSAKNIWLTEFGWSTASNATDGVSEAVQADYLTKAFAKLASYPYVARAYWYAGRNLYWGANNQSDIESNYGLMRVDFSLKPSYTAFKNAHTATTPPTTTPPTTIAVDVTAPTVSNIVAGSITTTTATISWTTNEAADSVVKYWPSGGTTRSAKIATLVTAHRVPLAGLTRNTLYNFRVLSTDAAGNLTKSATQTFRTAS